jgi:hypothetical protein
MTASAVQEPRVTSETYQGANAKCNAAADGGVDWYVRNFENRPVVVTIRYRVRYTDGGSSHENISDDEVPANDRKYQGCNGARTAGGPGKTGYTDYSIVKARFK